MFEEFAIAASTGDLADEPRAREHADIVEFRLDVADDPEGQLRGYDGALPLLATNRPTWEGGGSDADEGERLAALARAAGRDAVAAVDVELASVEDGSAADAGLLEAAREAGASVVVSVHDFEATPAPEEMRDLLGRAGAAGDVAKLAVTARTRADALDVLRVTHAADADGERVATMAMGAAGTHTRAVAPLYGSRIGYGPVDPDRATAPGQFDVATLADLVATLSAAD